MSIHSPEILGMKISLRKRFGAQLRALPNKVMIQMHAVMAEWERDQISKRTKDALAAAKARGVKLGTAGAANLRPNVECRTLRFQGLEIFSSQAI